MKTQYEESTMPMPEYKTTTTTIPCESCKYESLAHILDMLTFTLGDLGVKNIEGARDVELLEITDRKIRMLYNMCVSAGVDEEILRDAMNG
jgi:hypothetical protein